MISVKEAIVVEGIYDKTRLESFIDGIIVAVNGFNIFRDRKIIQMLKKLAQARGLVILTDSDRAGFLIRNYIKECIPGKYLKHAYIPEVKGKEKRKAIGSKEGLLGVEGISREDIISALQAAGCIIKEAADRSSADLNCQPENKTNKAVTKHDLFQDGLSGRPNSSELRDLLKKRLNLPSRLSVNNLLDMINALCSYEEYKELIEGIKKENQ